MQFKGLGVQKDTQTPCWLRPVMDGVLRGGLHQSSGEVNLDMVSSEVVNLAFCDEGV